MAERLRKLSVRITCGRAGLQLQHCHTARADTLTMEQVTRAAPQRGAAGH